MSIEAVMARISEIQGLTTRPAAPAVATGAAVQSAVGSPASAFQQALTSAGGPVATAAVATPPPAGGPGAQMVALAQQEVGQAEQPPGTNDSPRIAEYRGATAGSGVGPWCAYF